MADVVRVALDKLQQETQITLRVTPSLADGWRQHLRSEPGFGQRVEVLGDDSLGETACVVEASIGQTEIGLEAQLKEIEQGFCDLLARRPRSTQE